MPKELTKYCHIGKYIEHQHPKLYEILDDLCVVPRLRPRRGFNGVTFIIPTDATIKKLSDMRYNDSFDEARDILLAHIIQDFLPTGEDFAARKDDLPNGLNRKAKVKSATKDKITFENGAIAGLEKAFKAVGENSNQAVWRFEKGEQTPKDSSEKATFQYAKEGAPRPQVKGGYSSYDGEFDRKTFMARALAEYTANLVGVRNSDSPSKFVNNLLCDIVSFVRSVNNDRSYALLSPCIVTTFILIFSLNESEGGFSDAQVKQWFLGGRYPVNKPVTAYMELLDKRGVRGGAPEDNHDVGSRASIIGKAEEDYKKWAEKTGGDWRKLRAADLMRFYEVALLHDLESHANAAKAAGEHSPVIRGDIAEVVNMLFEILNERSIVTSADKAHYITPDALSTLSHWRDSSYYMYDGSDKGTIEAFTVEAAKSHLKVNFLDVEYDEQQSVQMLGSAIKHLSPQALQQLLKQVEPHQAAVPNAPPAQ